MPAIDPSSLRAESTLRPGSMRLGAAHRLRAVLAELGVAADQIIAEAGIEPDLFEDPESVVPFSAVGHLYASGAERLECPHLGLLIAERACFSCFGPLGSLMQSAPTLGCALRSLERHFAMRSRGAVIKLAVADDVVLLSYSPYEPGVRGAALQSDAIVGAIVVGIRLLLRQPNWSPIEVLLPRRCPSDTAPYRSLFRAPVRYNREVASIVLPMGDLDENIPGSDPCAYGALEKRLSAIEATSHVDFTDELRRMLRTDILAAGCSVKSVARRLDVDRRTVQRRLSAEGRTFRRVAGEVRYEIARQLLSDTSMSLAQISAVLDFSEPAAFTRAFRRWSGSCPSAWRDHQQPCSAYARSLPEGRSSAAPRAFTSSNRARLSG